MSAIAVRLVTQNAEQTVAVGRLLGEHLIPGDVVLLDGPLGAGKTQFAKGIAAGLGVPPEVPVVSPTFVLVREYEGRVRLFHCDLYRLGAPEEVFDLGIDQVWADRLGVVIVEWGDRFPGVFPPEATGVSLDHVPDNAAHRRLVLRVVGDRPALLAAIRGRAGVRA